ncbi:MAG TPA: Ig-like domain-containing protein, partial [Longilinea sp.]|nr:Ig-like domain-containing protein [Longilinea sp.]
MKRHLSNRAVFGFMVLTILVASGCGGTTAQPTPVQTPTSAFSIVPNTPLPPALVEVEPQAGSQVGLQGTITLYFNQAMDRASVEAAWQLQPAVSGTLKWLDDATLQFTPSSSFQPAQDLSLTIGVSAKASNGLALQDPISLSYQTADYLKILSVLPENNISDADPASAVVVSFNQPVAAVGSDSAQVPAAFTLQPQMAGQGEWLNSSTYIFYPQPALEGGKQYTVQLDGSLTGTMGSGFA